MRKPRDYDSELKALDQRAQGLKSRKLYQLGELVIATGADVLPIEVVAGALLSAAEAKDADKQEVWRARGAAFFQKASRKKRGAGEHSVGTPPSASGTLPFAVGAGAQ